MADSKKYNGSTWQHSLRKLTTATEAVENPLYSDGTAITSYTLKGNTVQNGTPTPSNPVEVYGVGDKTANLLPEIRSDNGWVIGYLNGTNGDYIAQNYNGEWLSPKIPLSAGDTITVSAMSISNPSMSVYYWNGSTYINVASATDYSGSTFTAPANTTHIRIAIRAGSDKKTEEAIISSGFWVMMNTGSTAKPYEPYGYKIPILSGGVTTNIYLGSTQTVRAIGKRIFNGSENWSLHGALNNVFWIDDYQDGYSDNAETGFAISNAFTQRAYLYVASLSNGQFVYGTPSGSSTKRILMKNTNCATKEDWIAYLQTQYANGTPVTVWYVLATSETAAVNEPLMKIGDYADTLSNATAIPTTEGANSITVDTTVQPSEFTATWTGWHNATVKEWDGSDWN